jgi:hypothetical protein
MHFCPDSSEPIVHKEMEMLRKASLDGFAADANNGLG